jgi:hypothetical protein
VLVVRAASVEEEQEQTLRQDQHLLMVQLTQAAVLVAIGLVHQPQAMAGLELSFCQFQHHVTREQLQEVQQSQPAGQAQF